MTKEERDVVDLLVKAWNSFLKLPVNNSDDVEEFRHAIHLAQNIVASRQVWIEFNESNRGTRSKESKK